MTLAQQTAPHVLVGVLSLAYAQFISGTPYVTTAVQFVSPLAVVMLAHLGWLALCRRLDAGYSTVVFRRSLITAIGIAAGTVLFAVVAPMPSAAASDIWDVFGAVLGVIGCLAVMTIVVGVPAAIIYFAARSVAKWLDRWRSGPPGPGITRLYDLGAVMIALVAIGIASLEGVPGAYSLAALDRASTTHFVAASPARVWQQVGRATSPDFPLPVMLHSIPRPVAVIVDEGAALGARRVVRFRGREGEGDLVLQVVRRTDEEAAFQAMSDDSPIANWVRHRMLTFRVVPDGPGSRLTVSLDYDRLLAPRWFFGPYIRLAAYLAVNVLARDTRLRAEAL